MSAEQMLQEFEAWYSQRWPGRSANVAMHSALEADAWEVWQAAQSARPVRVDGIGELGIRLPLKVDGVTALENGVLGVVVELPKQIGEMKCWIHDCKTVDQCAESGCAQRLATQPQAPQGGVTSAQLEAAFESEIAKVSHVAYDSNEICRHFFNNIRTALLAPTETPEAGK